MVLVGGYLEGNCKKGFECKYVHEQQYLTQIIKRQWYATFADPDQAHHSQ